MPPLPRQAETQKKLYRNVLSLRLAAIVFARSMQPPKKAQAQERLQWFLPKALSNKKTPGLGDLIKRFTSAVRRVQQAYRSRRMVRTAQADALLIHFCAENLVSKVMANMLKVQEESKEQAESKARAKAASLPPPPPPSATTGSKKGGKTGKASAAKASGQAPKEKEVKVEKEKEKEKPPSQGQGPGRRGAVKQPDSSISLDGAPDWLQIYRSEGEELLPLFIRKHVIRQHVFWMHSTYRSRIADYVKKKEELAAEIELKRLGLGDTKEKLKAIEHIPQVIEVARMPDLYQQTYDDFVNDAFRELIHSRARVMRKVFTPWVRLTNAGVFVERPEGDNARDFKNAIKSFVLVPGDGQDSDTGEETTGGRRSSIRASILKREQQTKQGAQRQSVLKQPPGRRSVTPA